MRTIPSSIVSRDRSDTAVQEKAIYSLCGLIHWSDTAARMAEAHGLLAEVLENLQSPDPNTVGWSCRMLGDISRYQGLQNAVMELNPCLSLIMLLKCVLLSSNCLILRYSRIP